MISHRIAIFAHLPTAFNLTVPSLTFRSALWGPFTPACSYFNQGMTCSLKVMGRTKGRCMWKDWYCNIGGPMFQGGSGSLVRVFWARPA